MANRSNELSFANKYILRFILSMNHYSYINLTASQCHRIETEVHYTLFNILDPRSNHMTCGLSYSFAYANYLSFKAYRQLRSKVSAFQRYTYLNNQSTYTYLLTLNPKKSNYKRCYSLNHKTVGLLKKSSKVALMQSAIENSFTFTRDDVHIHILIISTARLNQRQLRSKLNDRLGLKGKEINIEQGKTKADNDKLVHYVTKQYGLFLPLKWNKGYQMTQFQIVRAIINRSPKQAMKLIANDIKASQSIPYRHHYYVNTENEYMKSWRQLIKSTKVGKSFSLTIDVRDADSQKINHQTRHHTSQNEAISRFYGKGYYSIEQAKAHAHIVQISLLSPSHVLVTA